MNLDIFRKYDIRGRADSDLTDETVRKLGFVLGGMAEGGTIAVGRDCRLTGERLLKALSAGASAAGCRVLDLGVQTTPMTYFAAHTLKPRVTVMITGSHNPPEYNGFKMMSGLHTLWGDEIEDIRQRMIETRPVEADDPPSPERVSVTERYLDRLRAEFSPERSLKIAVDAGNGTGGECSVRLLKELGHRVIPLFCEPDGSFPNHHPDPTVMENLKDLRETVVTEGCDLGIAFDGDADRLGIVDERGNPIFGDRILCVLAEKVLADNPGATIISEVKASKVFFSRVEELGGKALMLPTGHSIIKEGMARENALLAGEMSGHIFFRDRYFGYDDALYAALRFMETAIENRRRGPVSSLTADLPDMFSTPEIREDCPDGLKFRLVDRVRNILEEKGYSVNDTDGVRVDFADGWGLLRASNTQPVLVMRFEARTEDLADKYEEEIRRTLDKAREDI
ncbi:MAG TPA: phosphomannomutase/phosphoglucomutase [Candidatus Sabulitectum sp.]|nr:phosphomannomutase/phosphoglucomutase [Candidatus Sabulitectum sp.]HPR21913.1 phosphomannomutase/phosphoglucomutase [Candidatus Sabulitectum sp.]